MDDIHFEKLFEHFQKYIKLSPAFKEELQASLHKITFKKGELIHHADKIIKY